MVRSFLRRPVHASWQLAAASLAVFAGVVLASFFTFYVTTLGWLLTGIALVALATIKQKRYVIVFTVLGGFIIGVWRGQSELINLHAYDGIIQTDVRLSGKVSEDIDRDKQGNAVLRLNNVKYNQRDLPGTLWVTIDVEAPHPAQ